jgi:hypothetical protein
MQWIAANSRRQQNRSKLEDAADRCKLEDAADAIAGIVGRLFRARDRSRTLAFVSERVVPVRYRPSREFRAFA